MIVEAFAFYLFASVTVASAVMVISARNPVHSVLFLILSFFNSAGRFVLLGAEFLALILVVVYVGAVAVLFLFVVMMLDVNIAALHEGFLQYLPTGGLIGLVLLVELAMVVGGWSLEPGQAAPSASPMPPLSKDFGNTEALGSVIYTDYVYLFQGAGLILLVAMIGAIVLTLRERPRAKRQNIARQVARRRDEAVELRKVAPGDGA